MDGLYGFNADMFSFEENCASMKGPPGLSSAKWLATWSRRTCDNFLRTHERPVQLRSSCAAPVPTGCARVRVGAV